MRNISDVLGSFVDDQTTAKNNDGERATDTQAPPQNGELLGMAVFDRAVCHETNSALSIDLFRWLHAIINAIAACLFLHHTTCSLKITIDRFCGWSLMSS